MKFFSVFIIVLTLCACRSTGIRQVSNNVDSTDFSESNLEPPFDPWESVAGLEEGNLEALAWKGDVLYAATDISGVYVWKGEEDGFELLYHNEGLQEGMMLGSKLVYHEPSDRFFFLAHREGGTFLFRSSDEGWLQTEKSGIGLLESDGKIYLRKKGMIEESEDGETWNEVVTVESEREQNLYAAPSFAVDSAAQKFYVINQKGLFCFNRLKNEWKRIPIPTWLPGLEGTGAEANPNAIFRDPLSGILYVAADGYRLYRSADAENWELFFNPESFSSYGDLSSLAIDHETGGIYVVISEGVGAVGDSGRASGSSAHIYYKDPSAEWEKLEGIGENAGVREVQFRKGRLWAAASDGLWSYDRRMDRWVHHSNRGLNTKNILALEFRDGALYAQSDESFVAPSSGEGDLVTLLHAIYRQISADEWELEKSSKTLSFSSSPSYDFSLKVWVFSKISLNSLGLHFMATDQGVFYSLGDGKWLTWNEGLPTYRFSSLAYHPGENILYAGTLGHGIYRLDLKRRP